MLKRLLRSNFFLELVGWLGAAYLRLVRATSKLVVEPADIYERAEKDWPIITTLWHGQLFMAPMIYSKNEKVALLVSRHRDGEIVARIARHCGFEAIRGSGSPERQVAAKGGAGAFRQMVRMLEAGASIGMTADVPKIAEKAGRGVIALAQASGRPIYPLALMTSRGHIFEKSWDRACLPLPFGRLALVAGEPLHIPPDADENELETARRTLEERLKRATERACHLSDKPYKMGR